MNQLGSYNIRPARVEDAPQIVDVVRSGIDPDLVEMTIYGCRGIGAYVVEQIQARPNGGDTLYTVACDGANVLGCVEMRLLPQGLFLNYISVLPEVRSMGLGPRLLSAAIEGSGRAGLQTISLDVFEHNTRAREWYERLGFELEDASEWWQIAPERSSAASGSLVVGWPQARVCWERFGFGQFRLVAENGGYDVGLLGDRWFRLTQPEALSDRSVLSALRAIDSSRGVLAIVSAGSVSAGLRKTWRQAAGSHRLHATITQVARSVAC